MHLNWYFGFSLYNLLTFHFNSPRTKSPRWRRPSPSCRTRLSQVLTTPSYPWPRTTCSKTAPPDRLKIQKYLTQSLHLIIRVFIYRIRLLRRRPELPPIKSILPRRQVPPSIATESLILQRRRPATSLALIWARRTSWKSWTTAWTPTSRVSRTPSKGPIRHQ